MMNMTRIFSMTIIAVLHIIYGVESFQPVILRSSNPHLRTSVSVLSFHPNYAGVEKVFYKKNSTTKLHLSLPVMNEKYVFTSILAISSFGIELEQRTKIGKALSAPLASMALALMLANFGLIPFESSIYSFINKNLVPLAVPMLLFDSDIRRVVRDTGSLLRCFFVGAFATIVGTLVAYPLIPMHSIGAFGEGWKVASALAARHIGGAINFVAVADTLKISPGAMSASIAADNIAVAIYFALLFFLAKENKTEIVDMEEYYEDNDENSIVQTDDPISISSIGWSFTVSSLIVFLGSESTKKLFPSTSSLPIISILSVLAATTFPKFFGRIRKTGASIGVLLMQMFLAATGAAGSISLVIRSAPAVFLFSLLQIGIHFATLMFVGKTILGEDANELYLASNANVGGPTTAAAMAQAKNWSRLVLPALLIGIFGYATGTAIALGLGQLLRRMTVFQFS